MSKRANTFPTTPHGSTNLTTEQQDWYLRNLGIRYTMVSQNGTGISRRMRRSKRKRDLG